MRRVRLSKFFFVRVFCITYCGSLQYYRVDRLVPIFESLGSSALWVRHPATIYVILYPRLLLERGSKRSTASSSLPSPPQQQQSNPFPHTFTGRHSLWAILSSLHFQNQQQAAKSAPCPPPPTALQFADALPFCHAARRSSYPPAVHVHMLRAQARLPSPHQKEA